MKKHWMAAGAACVFAFYGVACDGKKADDAPTPSSQEPAAQTKPDAPEPPAVSKEAARHVFHEGRLSLTFDGEAVGEPDLEKTDGKRNSDQRWSSEGAVLAVTIKESMLAGPQHEYDTGMLGFLEKSQRKGAREVLEEGTIELPALKAKARHFRAKDAAGKTSHTALFLVDPYTVALVIALEREPMTTAAFTAILRSFKVEKLQDRPVDPGDEITEDEVDAFLKKASERGAESAEDVAAMPTSTKPGEPGVANSCNLMTMECYETAPSAVGEGYYSDAKKCRGDFAQGRPCPSENRLGFCRLNDTQLITFYETSTGTTEERVAQCEKTYRGKWLGTPKARPWPRNAK